MSLAVCKPPDRPRSRLPYQRTGRRCRQLCRGRQRRAIPRWWLSPHDLPSSTTQGHGQTSEWIQGRRAVKRSGVDCVSTNEGKDELLADETRTLLQLPNSQQPANRPPSPARPARRLPRTPPTFDFLFSHNAHQQSFFPHPHCCIHFHQPCQITSIASSVPRFSCQHDHQDLLRRYLVRPSRQGRPERQAHWH